MKKILKKLTSLVLCLGLVLSIGLTVGCGDSAVTFEVCDDTSNAIRAFQLLEAKGVFTKAEEGDNYPVNEAGDELTIGATAKSWTNKAGTVTVTLVAENLLVSSLADYDFACLPCNTAYTGNVDSTKRAAVEDDANQVAGKANIIAARKADYDNDADYKAKIDALSNAMLSKEVSDFFKTKYLGAMTCDASTQIDLRLSKDATVQGNNKTIKVCASDVPHAEVLNGCVKDLLKEKGYTLEVTVLDWTIQNDSVASGDYDANYFQHVPYLETYEGEIKLFAACKVHYEPLGIYYGKATSWNYVK